MSEVDDLKAKLASMERQLDEAKALRGWCEECPNCGAVSEKGPFPPMDEDGCCVSCGADGSVEGLAAHSKEVEAERDEAQSQLRESQERELVLRERLEEVQDYRGACHCAMDDEYVVGRIASTLADTSAAAQRVKDEIERDVREAVWDKVKEMWGASPMQFRAAILGEKEKA